MLLVDFLNLIFSPFGISIMAYDDMSYFVYEALSSGHSLWSCFWTPDFLISFIAHIALAYGMFYICFVMPFRFLKKWLRVPNAKGKR